jgi:hypothetical protein
MDDFFALASSCEISSEADQLFTAGVDCNYLNTVTCGILSANSPVTIGAFQVRGYDQPLNNSPPYLSANTNLPLSIVSAIYRCTLIVQVIGVTIRLLSNALSLLKIPFRAERQERCLS